MDALPAACYTEPGSVGSLDPDQIHLPGIYVNRLVVGSPYNKRIEFRMTRERVAARAVRKLQDGFYVNLGIGIPTLVANHIPISTRGGRWRNVQLDYLLADGLLATHNAGNANIVGVEGTVIWGAGSRFRLTGGFTVQHARLEPYPGSGLEGDYCLPLTPDTTFRLVPERDLRVGATTVKPFVALNYIGRRGSVSTLGSIAGWLAVSRRAMG